MNKPLPPLADKFLVTFHVYSSNKISVVFIIYDRAIRLQIRRWITNGKCYDSDLYDQLPGGPRHGAIFRYFNKDYEFPRGQAEYFNRRLSVFIGSLEISVYAGWWRLLK